MKRFALLAVTMMLPMLISAGGFTPTTDYQQREINGWKVYINKNVLDGYPELLAKASTLLEFQLYQITRVVPETQLAEMKKVPIWIEHKPDEHSCACYHPSKEWLTENGYNPDKEKSVEISNLDDFLTWTLQQPWMILHEMAHAYHDKVIGWDDPKSEIHKLYANAVKSKKYEKVLFITGGTKKAYAITDHKEYFAETAEAYLGTNDMYPFVRSELKETDRQMYEYHKKIWAAKPAK
ncbi:MAG: hypothetical protein KAS23_12160 [Anaerohalosphaera sp.]|nr:hypothetical protein [Anaerohalosphaera sp.]